jgi:hypothetical protein
LAQNYSKICVLFFRQPWYRMLIRLRSFSLTFLHYLLTYLLVRAPLTRLEDSLFILLLRTLRLLAKRYTRSHDLLGKVCVFTCGNLVQMHRKPNYCPLYLSMYAFPVTKEERLVLFTFRPRARILLANVLRPLRCLEGRKEN